MSAETQQVQARLRYRGHRYNCDFRPGDNSVALLARLNAIRDFLRVQPEIQNEVFSVPDFEFVCHAASISVRDYPTSNGVINIESQRIKAPAFPAGNFRWHRSNIPRYQYFAEVFLFLRRRYSLITVPNEAEARQILSQPCDLHWKMCEYAARPWFCLVLGPRLDFFAQTVELLQQTSCFNNKPGRRMPSMIYGKRFKRSQVLMQTRSHYCAAIKTNGGDEQFQHIYSSSQQNYCITWLLDL